MEEEFNAKRPDLGAIEEFKRKESVYLERVLELDEITKKKEEQRKRHDNLRYDKLKALDIGTIIFNGTIKLGLCVPYCKYEIIYVICIASSF